MHLPDPIIDPADGTDPEHEALLADSVGLALLVVLETLAPAERLAFVLHDMFGVPFDEIAPIVDRSPEAARQLASRARRRVRGAAPTPDADLSAQWEVVEAFLAAGPRGRLRCAHRACSTPTWCSGPTVARPALALRPRWRGGGQPGRDVGRRRDSRCAGRWSTASPGW